jgi:uncharacterized alkaline shock family protein YloU
LASELRKLRYGVRAKVFRLCTRRQRREGTMDTPSTGHQEQVGSSSTPQSDRDLIVSDIVVSKIAGLTAQELEGVQVSSGSAHTLGSFLDRVSTSGHPRSVSATVSEEGVTIDLAIDVQYGKAIPQITEAVRSSVTRTVENEVGYEVGKIDITVNDVLLPEVVRSPRQVEKGDAGEPEVTPSIDRPAESKPSTAPSGEAYLDFWSRSLQQYRQMTDAFFRPYADRPRRTDGEKDKR